jgi:hypothetical protein
LRGTGVLVGNGLPSREIRPLDMGQIRNKNSVPRPPGLILDAPK